MTTYFKVNFLDSIHPSTYFDLSAPNALGRLVVSIWRLLAKIPYASFGDRSDKNLHETVFLPVCKLGLYNYFIHLQLIRRTILQNSSQDSCSTTGPCKAAFSYYLIQCKAVFSNAFVTSIVGESFILARSHSGIFHKYKLSFKILFILDWH